MDVAAPVATEAVPRPTTADAPQGSVLDGLLVVVVLALAFLLGSFPASNADLWLHLATGRLVAGGEYPFGSDPFSAIDPTPTWINHAWLFDLLLYALHRVAGGPALVVAKAALVTLLAGVLMLVRQRGGGLGLPAVATALVMLAVAPSLTLRPAVASFLLFAVLILMLHRRPRGAALWRLPLAVGVLFALWVNLDGGFLLGLLLLAAWLVGSLLQRVLSGGSGDEPHPPAALALALVAALLGCLVNPYLHRAFSLPSEFAPLALPEVLRRDALFEPLFRSPFSKGWWTLTGVPAATAYHLLLGLGLASFALNLGGWHWGRALAWMAFAWLGSTFWRLAPYFALLAGPVFVLNVQAFVARRAAARTEPLSRGATHARAFLAGAARSLALVGGLVLAALAWPGWLAADPGTAASVRRVGWRLAPEPTLERLAKRLAGWYDTGLLRSGEARGFHLAPEFAFYCAWFCPGEKALFDTRLTAPPEVVTDYAQLREKLTALTAAPPPGARERPEPPDELLRKYAITHLVAAGRPALEGGLARVMLAEPWRWPPWAIDGRGLIVGRRDPARPDPELHPVLRLDPVWLAVGAGVVKLPPPEGFPPPPTPTLWDRYLSGHARVPPDTAEAALWLVYCDTAQQRAAPLLTLAQLGAAVGRYAPLPVPDLTARLLDPLAVSFRLPQGLFQGTWRRSPDGKAARAAALLAVRAARRATRAAPDDYEGYLRLALAYGALDTDEALRRMQQVTALRQALDRIPAATAAGQFTAADERVIHELLRGLYAQATVPGGNTPPLDLILDSLERSADLLLPVAQRMSAAATPEQVQNMLKAVEAETQQLRQHADNLRREVRQQRDKLETGAAKLPPVSRAALACRYGLVKEALAALRDVDPKSFNPDAALQVLHLTLNLYLLTGEAELARDLLQSERLNPVTVLPPQDQPGIRALHIQTAAALGDYGNALTHLDEATRTSARAVGPPLAAALLSLVFPDVLPSGALSRLATIPSWGGIWPRGNQPAWTGDLIQTVAAVQQQADWLALLGILALEQGEVERAKKSFTQALSVAGPRLDFGSRSVAQGWLQLFE